MYNTIAGPACRSEQSVAPAPATHSLTHTLRPTDTVVCRGAVTLKPLFVAWTCRRSRLLLVGLIPRPQAPTLDSALCSADCGFCFSFFFFLLLAPLNHQWPRVPWAVIAYDRILFPLTGLFFQKSFKECFLIWDFYGAHADLDLCFDVWFGSFRDWGTFQLVCVGVELFVWGVFVWINQRKFSFSLLPPPLSFCMHLCLCVSLSLSPTPVALTISLSVISNFCNRFWCLFKF